jgi:hypothetical protein
VTVKLTDLDARFLKHEGDGLSREVDSLAEADGVIFQCPKCAQGLPLVKKKGRRYFVGVHSVICWFHGKVPDDLTPRPGRWVPSGTGLHDLTFVPGDTDRTKKVSVLLTGPGCGWHGFVRGGEATLK